MKKGDINFNNRISDEVKSLIADILRSDPNKRISIQDIY